MPSDIDILIEDTRWAQMGFEELCQRVLTDALQGLELEAHVSVLACNDVRIAELNRDFRDKNVATNVLSWPNEDLSADSPGGTPTPPSPEPDGQICLGDLALAFETCAREALAAKKALEDHTAHLLVHGLLHLLGYDHIDDVSADLMESLEIKILGNLGIANPY